MEEMINWLKSVVSRFGPAGPEASDSIDDVDDSAQDRDPGPEPEPEPEPDGMMPDIYADEHVSPPPDRKFLDPSSPDADKTTGFNPYDTARLHKK